MRPLPNMHPALRYISQIYKAVIMALVLGLLSACQYMPAPHLIIEQNRFCQSAFTGHSVRVLSWNIAKRGQHPHWQRDFLKMLTIYQPDFLLLQEVALYDGMQHTLEQTQLGWVFTPNILNRWEDVYAGVLAAATVQPIKQHALLSTVFEPFSNTPKVSLLTEYALAQRTDTLLVVNIHAINFVSTAKFKQQLDHLYELLAQHHGPMILAGDFNTWNQQRLRQLFSITSHLQLKHVEFAPHDQQYIRRFLLSPPLDHIFYRGFRERKHSADVLQGIKSSDHKPLFIELELLTAP